MTNQKIVIIHTDGACSGNPGPGGWGAILEYDGHEKELSGFQKLATNNQMELLAAIKALEALKKPSKVELYTDSKYVKDGITSWIHGWIKNGWKSSTKKPVKNVEYWKDLHTQTEKHDVSFHWVKGHAGHPGNERADQLATQEIEKNR